MDALESQSQINVPVSGSLDHERQVMTNVSSKKENKNEGVEGHSKVKNKPEERRKNFYPEAFDFGRKGVFVCIVCFRKFPSCLKVKKHFIQEHPKAFCALGHDSFTEPRIQAKLLLFCPKNCQYVTLKMDAFTHHLATCLEADFGSQDRVANQIDFMAEDDDDEDDGEDRLVENPHSVKSKSDQFTRAAGQGKRAEINPVNQLKENQLCLKCNAIFPPSHFLDCHMKLYHSHKSRRFLPSHTSVSHPNQQQNHQHVNTAPGRSGSLQAKGSRNDGVHKTFCEGGLLKHSSRLPSRLDVPSTSSTSSTTTSSSGTNLYNNCNPVRSKCRFTCKKCGMSLNKIQDFHVHMVMHEKEKHSNPAVFDMCRDEKGQLVSPARYLASGGNKIFTPNSQHSMLNRTPIYECVKCKLCFHQNKALLEHMKSHRSKVHQCHECGKAFSRSQCLNVHMRTHTGEKPCKCEICGASFRTIGTLRMHLKRHRGDKPFQCTICGNSFGARSTLETHLRTHTGEKPYQCAECGKSFSQSGSLNIHMKTHTGEKPFKCEVCGRAFIIRILLKKHMRVHTKEKPYRCGECGREFSNGACFNWHLRSHQKKAPRPPTVPRFGGQPQSHIQTVYPTVPLSDDHPANSGFGKEKKEVDGEASFPLTQPGFNVGLF